MINTNDVRLMFKVALARAITCERPTFSVPSTSCRHSRRTDSCSEFRRPSSPHRRDATQRGSTLRR
jgi:hypothetical protein